MTSSSTLSRRPDVPELTPGPDSARRTFSILAGISALAVLLHKNHDVVAGKHVEFLPFALFIGASMSVTAFPVLARILTERGLLQTVTSNDTAEFF